MMIRPTCLISAALVAALAGTALADGNVTMNAGNGSYANTNGGGAFTATTDQVANPGYIGEFSGTGNTQTSNSFQTFCLQINEHISLGSSYHAAIMDHTVAAGNSNWDPVSNTITNSGIDTVSESTAFLYSTFRNNFSALQSISNLSATSGKTSIQIAAALQLAIWYLEGELRSVTNNQTTVYNNGYNDAYNSDLLAQQMANWAMLPANRTSMYGVRALVLSSGPNNSTRNQDMLTIVPLPPAAFAGMGTLAGVIGLGYIRRRRLANA